MTKNELLGKVKGDPYYCDRTPLWKDNRDLDSMRMTRIFDNQLALAEAIGELLEK